MAANEYSKGREERKKGERRNREREGIEREKESSIRWEFELGRAIFESFCQEIPDSEFRRSDGQTHPAHTKTDETFA